MLVVAGVKARPDPGDRGHDRSGRAGSVGAATTAAQITVNGTVAPIVAALPVAGIVGDFFSADAGDREQGKCCRTSQYGPEAGNHAPS